MRCPRLFLALLAAMAMSPSLAQQQVQVPQQVGPPAGGTLERIPYDIPYGIPILLEPAKKLVAAAEAEAKARGWKMNIAVVDPNGDLIVFVRMDGAQLASAAIAQRKARIAARFRRETRVFYNAAEAGHSYVATLDPEMVASPGGFPLVSNDRIIGAIGCSGGTGDQDALVCMAGVDLVR